MANLSFLRSDFRGNIVNLISLEMAYFVNTGSGIRALLLLESSCSISKPRRPIAPLETLACQL